MLVQLFREGFWEVLRWAAGGVPALLVGSIRGVSLDERWVRSSWIIVAGG